MKASKFIRGLATCLAALGLATVAFAPSADAAKKKKKPAAEKSTGKAAKGDKKDAAGEKAPDGDTRKTAAEEAATTTGPSTKIRAPGRDTTVSRDALADKKRDEAIDQLKKLIPTFPEGPQKADLLFQLAEMYWEKSKFLYAGEMEDYNKAEEGYIACMDAGQKKCKKPKLSTGRSDVFKKQAIDIYRRILDGYPDYPRNDEVLFILAQNVYETGRGQNDEGKIKEAMGLYWDLIKRFPQSGYVPDSYVQMGEHYFNSNQLSKAVTAFSKALEFKQSKVYPFALYKLAWCDYNLGQYDEAIKKFQSVVAYGESGLQLKAEALNDLVLSFSQVDAVEDAQQYYEKVAGPEMARDLFSKVAFTYVTQGKSERAIQSFRILINNWPNHERAPSWQNEIVQAYFKMNDQERVLKEMRRLVELYGPDSPWAKYNEANKSAVAAAYELTENAMRELVTNYHHEAQRTKRDETYFTAQQIYAEYLRRFPTSEHAYRLRFFFSEILYLRQEFEEAAKNYRIVVLDDATCKDQGPSPACEGPYTKTSAYNQVLAWEQLAKGFDKRKEGEKLDEAALKKREKLKKEKVDLDAQLRKAKESGYKEEEIPEVEKNLADACQLYVKLAPEAADVLPVRLKEAYIYVKYNRFTEAAERYGGIIDRWPTDDNAKTAARMMITVFNLKEDWPNLNKWARAYRKNSKLVNTAAFATELDEVIQVAAYKEIQGIEKAATETAAADPKAGAVAFDDVATRFVGYQEEFPDSKYSDKALYNAVVIYDKADKLDRATEMGERFLAKYTKADEELRANMTLFLGNFYERIADFKRSAGYYARFADDFKKHEKRCDAIYNAGVYYQGMQESALAVKQYELYGKECDKNADSPDVYLRIGAIHEKDKAWKKAADLFEQFEKKFGKRTTAVKVFDTKFRYAMAVRQLQNIKESDRVLEILVKSWNSLEATDKRAPPVVKAVATAAFLLVEPTWNKYIGIKLQLPIQKMKAQLKEKLALVDTLAKDDPKKPGLYVTVLAYQDPDHAIAALYRIGSTYKELATSLFDAPIPPNLSDEQAEIYQAELQSMAFPLEEKAITAYESCIGKAYELKIYNDWVVKCQEQLATYKPGSYPEVRELPTYSTDVAYAAEPSFTLSAAPAPAPEPAPAPAPGGDTGAPAVDANDATGGGSDAN